MRPGPTKGSRRTHRRRGIALIIVLLVVLTLVLIASPFVLSMLAQERTAAMHTRARRARIGAEGVRNFAVAWMTPGLDYMERRFPIGIFGTPFHDTPAEFAPQLTDDRLRRHLDVADERGPIWGITVRDEQGKVNLRSAPKHLVDRLRDWFGRSAADFRDYTTIYSDREAKWICPQRIRAVGEIETLTGETTLYGIQADDAVSFGAGARVRITKPGLPTIETVVVKNHLMRSEGGRANAFLTKHAVAPAYAGGVIEIERRHPVNVNTVPREVLVALFTKLKRFAFDHEAYINRSVAEGFADFLKRPPTLRTMDELVARLRKRVENAAEALAKGEITYEQYNAISVWTGMIIVNSLDPTNAWLVGTGTMPLTTVSGDTVTIEAICSVNNPSRVAVAQRGFREVVRLGAPDPIDRRWECQYDLGRAREFFPMSGNGIVVSPFPEYPMRDLTLRPQQSKAKGNESWVQLAPGYDCRGYGTYLDNRFTFAHDHGAVPEMAKGIPFPINCEGHEHTYEGLILRGGTLNLDWKKVLSPMPKNGGPPDRQRPDVAAGAATLWIRFTRYSDPVTLFDIRREDFEDRLTLTYESGFLVLSAADACIGAENDPIGNGLAEVRYPFVPEPDTWYHIGAYWKGTHYANLALLVDGFGHPGALFTHRNEAGEEILTVLASAIAPEDTTFALQDDSFLPDGPTPVRIGGEVILYDRATGNHVRGARGTTEAPHPAGAKVQVFGYSSKVRKATLTPSTAGVPPLPYDRICTGGGSVLHPFGAGPAARVDGDKVDPVTGRTFIDDKQTKIPVLTADLTEFPMKGYLVIEQEVIYFDGLQFSPPAFTGCARGQHGTAPATHDSGTDILLWSVGVDTFGTPGPDSLYLTPTILQLGSEWIGPVQKDPVRPGFWIGMQAGIVPQPLSRGVLGTAAMMHMKGEPVMPTWVARDSDPAVSRLNCGAGDVVTLVHSDGSKTRMRIRRAADVSGGFLTASTGPGTQLVAFDANVFRVHAADDLHARVLKFPSGELVGLRWLTQANPELVVGPLDARVDQLAFLAGPKQHRAWKPGPGGRAELSAVAGMREHGGAVKVGDEILGYAHLERTRLEGVRRGFLRTPQHVHDAGDDVFHLDVLPVSALREGVGPEDPVIPLHQPLPGIPLAYRAGYALIDEEVIRFRKGTETLKARTEPVMELEMPETFEGGRGLYRGRFGTTPQAHAADALAYGIPWRYLDTYAPEEYDNSMACWQVSTNLPDAHWRKVTWEQEIPADDRNIVVHAIVRVDGKGEMYDRPGPTDAAYLWEFTDPDGWNRIERTGATHRAGQLDIRFHVEYREGAFWPNHSWKRTPRIFEVKVEYERPTKVLFHEDW